MENEELKRLSQAVKADPKLEATAREIGQSLAKAFAKCVADHAATHRTQAEVDACPLCAILSNGFSTRFSAQTEKATKGAPKTNRCSCGDYYCQECHRDDNFLSA